MENDKTDHPQSTFLEADYFPIKIFLILGACICALIGVLYSVITTYLLFKTAFYRIVDALILISYTLLAFVPFAALVYPRLRARRKSVYFGAALIEFLVLGLFIWSFLENLKD